MLSERIDQWIAQREQELEEKIIKKGIEQGIKKGIEQGIEQGIAKGIAKGIEKGIGKGECLVLQRLMAKRFGPLPEWALRRLESATQTELEHWTEQILDAVSLEALFQ